MGGNVGCWVYVVSLHCGSVSRMHSVERQPIWESPRHELDCAECARLHQLLQNNRGVKRGRQELLVRLDTSNEVTVRSF